MPKPVIAVIGRPNVGKSLLFNRIVGQKLSIVEDTPGVTRDRLYADAEWAGKEFSVIDTGGIEPRADNEILKFMRMQAELAIDHADVIIFVTDIRTGVTAADMEVAQMLLKSKKPIVLAVNKVDSPGNPPPEIYEFYNLGLGDPIGISALHGYASGDLLDECFSHIPDDFNYEEDNDKIKVCVIGKPNAGKSSLINKILGEERVIVSNVAGTTRDSVDTEVSNEHGEFTFIDTAGIRKKSKVDESIERYSVMRALMAVERADVVLIMINAEEGVTEQDTKIAGEAHNRGKAAIILVNKWDLIEKDGKTIEEFTAKIRHDLIYMTYAPILFISAKTGQRVHKLFELIAYVNDQTNIRITTGQLNNILAEATSRVQPPSDKGKRLKIYYMTQAGVKPPTFIMFCNEAQLFHFSYRRYIENQLRAVYKLEGTPIKMIVRQKGDDGDK
ncbi:MAG: ribosome biogenesis GTPase Der [Clostridia bacterium]